MAFASSAKSGSEEEDSNNESPKSNSRSPSPVPARRRIRLTSKSLVNPFTTSKRPAIEANQSAKRKAKPSTNPFDVTSTPAPKKRQSTTPPVDESNSPNLKRQRTLRKNTTPVVYSQKWHPMDDVLTPKRAAKAKAKSIRLVETSDSDYDTQETDPGRQSENSDADEEPVATFLPIKARCNSHPVRPHTHAPACSPSPDRRRSRRSSGKADAPNYNMK